MNWTEVFREPDFHPRGVTLSSGGAHRPAQAMEHGTLLLVLAALGALFMAFNNGANDVANSFASAVGAKIVGSLIGVSLAAGGMEAGRSWSASGSTCRTCWR